MTTPTSSSNQFWLERNQLKMERCVRQYKFQDRDYMLDLIFNIYPDEGRKLVENYNKPMRDKYLMFLDWLITNPVVICAIYGYQRSGKDATICMLFEDIIKRCLELGIKPPRFVTLMNMRNPPFVKPEDMYFSFENIPPGTDDQEVWIYCSEMELVLPAREGTSQGNRLYGQLSGTLAQNHQKLFGACKLAAKVDLNFIRDCNAKIFKYIVPESLAVEGVERKNIITGLGLMLVPKNPLDKSLMLTCFDQQLFHIRLPLPEWWTQQYSEQFRDVPLDKIQEYIKAMYTNGMKEHELVVAIKQKFRKSFTEDDIISILGPLAKKKFK